MTIKKAVQIASVPEVLEAQSIETIEEIVAVITASQDKKAHKKLDIVKGILANKKKAGADTAKIEQIENSIKGANKPKVIRPSQKAKEQAQKQADKVEEQATLELDAEPKTLFEKQKITLAQNIVKAEKMADLRPIAKALGVTVKVGTSTEKLRTQLLEAVDALKELPKEPVAEQQPEKQEPEKAPQADGIFPNVIEAEGGVEMKRIQLGDLATAIYETPYKVICLIQEPGADDVTQFLVTYANKGVVVLLDVSVEIDSVLPMSTKSFNKKHQVKLDGEFCPVAFYQPTK